MPTVQTEYYFRVPNPSFPRRLATVLALGMAIASPAMSQTSEYAVKAAFLVNFVRFIDWPNARGNYVVGVLGENPFGRDLEQAAASKSTKDRKITVRYYKWDQTVDCNLLFVPASESSRFGRISATVSKQVVIVGEYPEFASKHGHINFVIEKKRVGFEINRTAIRNTGVVVSSKLMQLAKMVN